MLKVDFRWRQSTVETFPARQNRRHFSSDAREVEMYIRRLNLKPRLYVHSAWDNVTRPHIGTLLKRLIMQQHMAVFWSANGKSIIYNNISNPWKINLHEIVESHIGGSVSTWMCGRVGFSNLSHKWRAIYCRNVLWKSIVLRLLVTCSASARMMHRQLRQY